MRKGNCSRKGTRADCCESWEQSRESKLDGFDGKIAPEEDADVRGEEEYKDEVQKEIMRGRLRIVQEES
jgi:hypothetical protein